MTGESPISVLRLALLTDFTPDFLAGELRKAGQSVGIKLELLSLNPSSREAQTMNSESALVAFKPDIILSALSGPTQWTRFQSEPAGTGRLRFGEALAESMVAEWQRLKEFLPHVEIWQTNLGAFADGIAGTEATRHPQSFSYQRDQFNQELKRFLVPHRHVTLIDWNAVIETVGLRTAYDPRLWLTAAHPFSLECLPQLATPVLSRLMWRSGRFIKVLVVDLDNTLWGGETGEVGPNDLEIGQEGMGNVYRNFQLWLSHLKETGVLLTVVSKNTDEAAREPFLKNPEMRLGIDDFAAFKAGWDPKSGKIQEIASELNIGLEAFCFIDDSPFEREEVRSRLPQVSIPEMPADPAEWIPFLAAQCLFESGPHSSADTQRTQWIREAAHRKAVVTDYRSYGDYLHSLSMRARAVELHPETLSRAHQLIMRTNQFNLRTIRHSLEALEGMIDSPAWISRLFGLRDRYGDYGWVSLVLIHTTDQPPGTAFLDSWLMSCRVFERDLEHFILNQVVSDLISRKYTTLLAEFRPTAKNGKFADLLGKLGFAAEAGNRWRLDLARAPVHQTHITADTPSSDA